MPKRKARKKTKITSTTPFGGKVEQPVEIEKDPFSGRVIELRHKDSGRIIELRRKEEKSEFKKKGERMFA